MSYIDKLKQTLNNLDELQKTISSDKIDNSKLLLTEIIDDMEHEQKMRSIRQSYDDNYPDLDDE